MRRCFAALGLIAVMPGLAACAGSVATARLDLKDACVFTPGPVAEAGDVRDRLPTGTMTLGTFNEVPFHMVSASLARQHHQAETGCLRHIG